MLTVADSLLCNVNSSMACLMIKIYYDGECPFCTNFVKYFRLKDASGSIDLINIREDEQAFAFLTEKNFDLDEGMVVELNGQFSHGDDALNTLALMSSRSSLFNRLNAAIFSSKKVSRALYPVLRAGRNLTLFFLGREKLAPQRENLDSYHIFAFMLGFFSIMHFIIYATRYGSLQITSFTTLIFGIALAMNPKSQRFFVLLLGSLFIDGILHAPIASNHTIIKNFLIVGIILTGFWQLWLSKNANWQKFYEAFVPIGRCLLLAMYFFGIFHKINTDFLNPVSSCAVSLMHQMPLVSALADQPWAQYTGIWSTFVIEGGVLVALIVPKWRYYGIVVGVAFHIMLATSSYAFYPTFSTLSIMLHSLFLPADTLSRFRGTALGRFTLGSGTRVRNQYLLISFIAVLLILGIFGTLQISTLPWFLWALPFLFFVFQCAKNDARQHIPVFPRTAVGIVVVVLFLLNCFSPYLGIKSAQSINMFANLHLEDGRSNHLIVTSPPTLFDYMSDVVEVQEVSGNRVLSYYQEQGYQFVYYGLLDMIERERSTVVTFKRGGVVYTDQSYTTLQAEIDAVLLPRFFRKWQHFSTVSMAQPKPCSLYN